jgi:hypothetical protein
MSDPFVSWNIRAVYCELILHVHLDIDPHLRVPACTNARLWGEIPDQVVAADFKRDAVPGTSSGLSKHPHMLIKTWSLSISHTCLEHSH